MSEDLTHSPCWCSQILPRETSILTTTMAGCRHSAERRLENRVQPGFIVDPAKSTTSSKPLKALCSPQPSRRCSQSSRSVPHVRGGRSFHSQLKDPVIDFVCHAPQHGCSSAIGDDIITDPARAMPKPKNPRFGDRPCAAPSNVTTKRLVALPCYRPHLPSPCIHFQAATLGLSEIPRAAPQNQPTAPREECVLTDLNVGSTHLPEEFSLVVAQIILRIFLFPDQLATAIKAGRRLRKNSQFPNESQISRVRNSHLLHLIEALTPPPRSHARLRALVAKYSQF